MRFRQTSYLSSNERGDEAFVKGRSALSPDLPATLISDAELSSYSRKRRR